MNRHKGRLMRGRAQARALRDAAKFMLKQGDEIAAKALRGAALYESRIAYYPIKDLRTVNYRELS